MLDASLIGVIVGAAVVPSPWSALVGLAGFAVGGAAWRGRRDLAAASLFASASVAVAMAVPFGWVWPIPPVVALGGFVLLVGRARRLGVGSWCRIGDGDRRAIGVALASVPLSTVALVVFIASGRCGRGCRPAGSLPYLCVRPGRVPGAAPGCRPRACGRGDLSPRLATPLSQLLSPRSPFASFLAPRRPICGSRREAT